MTCTVTIRMSEIYR